MTRVVNTIGDLLQVPGGGMDAAQVESIAGSIAFAPVKKALAVLPPAATSGAASAIATALDGVFTMPLGDVLASAWNERRELVKFTDTKEYPPDVVSSMTLANKSISREATQRVIVELDGVQLPPLEFTLAVELDIEAAVLKIKDARILSVRAGTCQGKATLKCGEAILADPETRAFEIRGEISFGSGIPIRDIVG